MRQQIDCAVLSLATHDDWMAEAVAKSQPSLTRIKLHYLKWEDTSGLPDLQNRLIRLDTQAIAQGAVSLRRYDVCLIPVSLDTLGWTRQALAAIPKGPFTPMFGILSGLRSAAMQDLVDLGMADFVRVPVCPEELRARILTAVVRAPKIGGLREPESAYGTTSWCEQAKLSLNMRTGVHKSSLEKPLQRTVRPTRVAIGTNRVQIRTGVSLIQVDKESIDNEMIESFRSSKSKVVEQFEREYISKALLTHQGNIASAARASQKHRRAFWALMRKYQIDASQYRIDDGAE
ncbi:MAG TPA: hypothetical protein DDY24_06755 [Alcaligenaceae bacterium]|nr:hypothetical protein [Alcaligenaceae bacterium]